MVGFLNKLFRNPKKSSTEEEVQAPPAEKEKTVTQNPGEISPMHPKQLLVGCAQSTGIQRDHNEDALFTLVTTLVSDVTEMPIGLFIVADGMGGHLNGEVASGLAVRALASQIVQKLYLPLYNPIPSTPAESLQEIMREGMREAHIAITKEAPGGGTTMTGVLLLGDQLTIAHVGDSRAYSIPIEGDMQPLTRDHSLVKRLVELGQITTEEAAVHPQRNVLYRALGQGEPFDADITTLPCPESGYIMICSDGLWGVVKEETIQQLVRSSRTPLEACNKMVDAANEAGGPDNIAVVLVQLPGV
jgi:serine/threonine protein phosphatase PrpC